MDQNVEFLNYIYQNSQMGISTIKQLLTISEDPEFNKQLEAQLAEYRTINDKAVSKLHEMGQDEEGLPKVAEVSSYMTISIKTLLDKSPSHIAEMMIQGSTMGVTDVTKNLKKYPEAEKDIRVLAEKLLKTEESNIEQLKKFL